MLLIRPYNLVIGAYNFFTLRFRGLVVAMIIAAQFICSPRNVTLFKIISYYIITMTIISSWWGALALLPQSASSYGRIQYDLEHYCFSFYCALPRASMTVPWKNNLQVVSPNILLYIHKGILANACRHYQRTRKQW